jgi:hypothetical protein
MDGPEHRSALSVGDGHFDLHQAQGVHDDAVELPAFADKPDDLAFRKDLIRRAYSRTACHARTAPGRSRRASCTAPAHARTRSA